MHFHYSHYLARPYSSHNASNKPIFSNPISITYLSYHFPIFLIIELINLTSPHHFLSPSMVLTIPIYPPNPMHGHPHFSHISTHDHTHFLHQFHPLQATNSLTMLHFFLFACSSSYSLLSLNHHMSITTFSLSLYTTCLSNLFFSRIKPISFIFAWPCMATPNSIPVCQSSRMHGHSYLHTRLPILHSHRFHHSHANSASCTWPLMSRSISLHPYTHLSVPTSLTHHLSIPSKLTKPSHLATLHPSFHQ